MTQLPVNYVRLVYGLETVRLVLFLLWLTFLRFWPALRKGTHALACGARAEHGWASSLGSKCPHNLIPDKVRMDTSSLCRNLHVGPMGFLGLAAHTPSVHSTGVGWGVHGFREENPKVDPKAGIVGGGGGRGKRAHCDVYIYIYICECFFLGAQPAIQFLSLLAF